MEEFRFTARAPLKGAYLLEKKPNKQQHCPLEMVVFTFFVFFPKELFGTRSLGPLESISSVGTKKSRSHVWHGSVKVIVVTYVLGRGAKTVVQSVLLVKHTQFWTETQ